LPTITLQLKIYRHFKTDKNQILLTVKNLIAKRRTFYFNYCMYVCRSFPHPHKLKFVSCYTVWHVIVSVSVMEYHVYMLEVIQCVDVQLTACFCHVVLG